MGHVDVTVRAPTGSAWVAAVASIVVVGEVFYERSRSVVATFLGVPFSADESLVLLLVAGLAAAVSAGWLLALYVRPGRLRIGEAGIERVVGVVRRRVIAAPLASWQVRIAYFDAAAKVRHDFKRIALDGPDYREVLLFGDVRERAALLVALADVATKLAGYEETLEKSA